MASELRRVFPDGVGFRTAGGLTDADGVPDLMAGALGLYGRSTQTGTVAIVEYLRKRTLVLVLDHCEHVVDEVALLPDTLLRNCPGVRILATSREPLRVDGEAVRPVSPLTCPALGDLADDGLRQYEAVQLFLDRARASGPGFVLTDSNRAAVATICRRLEGIPLAIELAAARLPTLSTTELEKGLTDQWELLSRGRRTAPHRQSTKAACIEWSFNLCDPAERRLWAKAAVFVDGFEYDAAAVCSDPGDEPIAETLASSRNPCWRRLVTRHPLVPDVASDPAAWSGRQGRRWCDRMLAGGGDPTARALALRSACWWAALQGDVESAASLLEDSRTRTLPTRWSSRGVPQRLTSRTS
jgi:serine/threonine-protein kinase PknK